MPHQCVRCSTFYEDGAKEILEGCKCGCKLFFFIKKEKLERLRAEQQVDLDQTEREQIEEDIYDLVGHEIDTEKTVVLDLEAIRVLKPGQYEIDIVHLFKNEPLVFRLEDGKYMVDIKTTFKRKRKD